MILKLILPLKKLINKKKSKKITFQFGFFRGNKCFYNTRKIPILKNQIEIYSRNFCRIKKL